MRLFSFLFLAKISVSVTFTIELIYQNWLLRQQPKVYKLITKLNWGQDSTKFGYKASDPTKCLFRVQQRNVHVVQIINLLILIRFDVARLQRTEMN